MILSKQIATLSMSGLMLLPHVGLTGKGLISGLVSSLKANVKLETTTKPLIPNVDVCVTIGAANCANDAQPPVVPGDTEPEVEPPVVPGDVEPSEPSFEVPVSSGVDEEVAVIPDNIAEVKFSSAAVVETQPEPAAADVKTSETETIEPEVASTNIETKRHTGARTAAILGSAAGAAYLVKRRYPDLTLDTVIWPE